MEKNTFKDPWTVFHCFPRCYNSCYQILFCLHRSLI